MTCLVKQYFLQFHGFRKGCEERGRSHFPIDSGTGFVSVVESLLFLEMPARGPIRIEGKHDGLL